MRYKDDGIKDHVYSFVRQKVSDRLLFVKPPWFNQALSDMKRHEGFREFAYPDPLSKLWAQFPELRNLWGFKPAKELLKGKKGYDLDDGAPWTNGYGFTHGVTPDSRISVIQADRKLEEEVIRHALELDDVTPQWKKYPVLVQTVLVNLIFNMGAKTLREFTTTLKLIDAGKYKEAGINLKKSLWYRQTKTRAVELTTRLITGQVAPEHQYKEK